MTTETYGPDDLFWPDLAVTTVGHFQEVDQRTRLTPIMLDATVGTFKVWDGSVVKPLASLPPQLILAPVLQRLLVL